MILNFQPSALSADYASVRIFFRSSSFIRIVMYYEDGLSVGKSKLKYCCYLTHLYSLSDEEKFKVSVHVYNVLISFSW